MRGMTARWLLAFGVALLSPLSASADEPTHELRLAEVPEVNPGATGAVSLTIAPDDGWTISRDGPLRITLAVTPSIGVSLPRRRYVRADAADARADAPRFDLRFKAVTAGDYTVGLDVRFWLCARQTCHPVRERRTVALRVVAPAPAAPEVDAGAPPPVAAP